MLRLEKLELHGFKSFHDRTEIAFDHGVTAVVGPNGCGKSNILDAMSWVLGEQSMKSLRGSASEDLIFSGTERKRPLGMAEVTLRLKATNGDLPSGQDAVAVTRRLFRSGESEYLLNGVACRLKDIQDLLYGSGLGVRAYSFIEQGRIGWILQAKPLDRRALIEEAAGITKFRAKKREAEFKLESAQANLARVQDIIAEVERQLGSLKRQAARARRWERTDAELKATLRELYVRERASLAEREAEAVERFRAAAELRQVRVREVQAAESDLEGLRLAIEKQEAAVRGTSERLHETEIEVDRNRTLIVTGRERIDEIEARSRELVEAAAAARARLADTEAEVERKSAAAATAAGRESEASGELERRREARIRAETAVLDAEHAIELRRGELLRAVHELAESGNAVAARARLLEQTEARCGRAAAERKRLEAQAEALAAELEATRAEGVACETAVREREAEVRLGFERAAELGRDRDRTREHEVEAVRMLHRHEERERTIARITQGAEDAGEATAGARALLGERALGLVADFVRAEASFERAVEAALDPVLGALVVRDLAAAEEAIAWAGGQDRGVVRVIVAGAAAGAVAPPPAVLAEPGVHGPLLRFLEVRSEVAGTIEGRLANTVLVDGLGRAVALAARHPGTTAVTAAGDVVGADGLLRSGGVSGTGLLALRRERRELGVEIARLQRELDGAKARLEELETGAAEAEAEARAAVAKLHQAEKDLLAARHRVAAAEDTLRKAREAAAAAASELGELERERDEVAAQLEAERARRAACEARRQEVETALEAHRRALEGARAEAGERAREVAGAEAELARAEEVRKALRSELRRLEEASDERRRAVEALAGELQAARERGEAVSAEVAAAEEALSGLLAEVAALGDRLRGDEDRARSLRHELVGREAALKELRVEAEMQRERVQVIEIERTRIEGELERLAERCREDLGTTLEELEAAAPAAAAAVRPIDAELGEVGAEGGESAGEDEAGPEGGLSVLDLESLRARAEELKARIQRIGPVNTLAIQEYQELKERHDFQSAQARDLTESIESLMQTIARINRTSRERFLDCYEAVNRSFQEIFGSLFAGGRAELRLTDEENLLETGIDIVAQPPGKRLQNILLLSGGEKALTALALLFSLFRYKPSPFCILDEVDAPLDEKNIDRFLALLKTLAGGTQFILITHSPRTMRVADTLYGVTMEEPGVSRLVSVKLNDAAA